MGFDPPDLGEAHEVCIELEGPVGAQAFAQFEAKVRQCIQDLRNIQDQAHGNARLKVKKAKVQTKLKP